MTNSDPTLGNNLVPVQATARRADGTTYITTIHVNREDEESVSFLLRATVSETVPVVKAMPIRRAVTDDGELIIPGRAPMGARITIADTTLHSARNTYGFPQFPLGDKWQDWLALRGFRLGSTTPWSENQVGDKADQGLVLAHTPSGRYLPATFDDDGLRVRFDLSASSTSQLSVTAFDRQNLDSFGSDFDRLWRVANDIGIVEPLDLSGLFEEPVVLGAQTYTVVSLKGHFSLMHAMNSTGMIKHGLTPIKDRFGNNFILDRVTGRIAPGRLEEHRGRPRAVFDGFIASPLHYFEFSTDCAITLEQFGEAYLAYHREGSGFVNYTPKPERVPKPVVKAVAIDRPFDEKGNLIIRRRNVQQSLEIDGRTLYKVESTHGFPEEAISEKWQNWLALRGFYLMTTTHRLKVVRGSVDEGLVLVHLPSGRSVDAAFTEDGVGMMYRDSAGSRESDFSVTTFDRRTLDDFGKHFDHVWRENKRIGADTPLDLSEMFEKPVDLGGQTYTYGKVDLSFSGRTHDDGFYRDKEFTEYGLTPMKDRFGSDVILDRATGRIVPGRFDKHRAVFDGSDHVEDSYNPTNLREIVSQFEEAYLVFHGEQP